MKKRLGVGIDLFRVLRENNCYYVDKTDFIRRVAGSMGSVLLYTRPRRFGKTLALSTLKEFFLYFVNRKSPKGGADVFLDLRY